jgi:hypothetical protein
MPGVLIERGQEPAYGVDANLHLVPSHKEWCSESNYCEGSDFNS